LTIYDKDESYSIIEFNDHTDKEALDLRMALMEDLSVFVDGYKFSPKFRAGVWDGKKYYFKMLKDMSMQIPKGLVGTVLKRFNQHMTEDYVPLKQPPEVTRQEILDHAEFIGLPFEPYDYQIDAVLKSMNEPRSILVAATGAGKSLIIYLIMTFHARQKRRGLLIVPNVGLAEQMQSDFLSYGMTPEDLKKHFHTIYAGKEKNFNKLMTTTTWQSAILMNSYDFNALDYVLIDEAHLATGESLQKLLSTSKNCLWKIGLTGTLPKTYEGRFTLAATLGKSKKIITPQGLIERGLATPVTIVTVYFNYPLADKAKVKLLKNYQKEVKYIEEHFERNRFIARMVIQATEKYGNSLIMYNSISHGEFLLELILMEKFNIDKPMVLEKVTPKRVGAIKEEYPDGVGVFVLTEMTEKDRKTLLKFYSASDIENIKVLSDYHIYLIKGSIEGETRNEIRSLLENVEDGMIIGSAQTVSTGMNVKRLHNFFASSSTKSSIRLNQSIGRGMRLHEDKDMLRYFDFIDDFSTVAKTGRVTNKNYVLKHSYERLNEYIEHGYPIKEIEITLNGGENE